MGEEVLTKRFLVEGKVQGVFFRASTKAEAERLGLRGYARNLADGRVEVVATGKPKALLALTRWLYRGPPQARVDSVTEAPVFEQISTQGFEIL
ncbi:MAG: acylphosphatase [Xanthomonadaceae bacterium]|nr:acylphosphatase [Xanthomonadaceae bacterium]